MLLLFSVRLAELNYQLFGKELFIGSTLYVSRERLSDGLCALLPNGFKDGMSN